MSFTYITDGKENTVDYICGETLLEAARRLGLSGIPAACGGNGTCGKCRVTVVSEEGTETVLACQCRARDGIRVYAAKEGEMLVEKRGMNVLKPEEVTKGKGFGIACDIGTTTVAVMLVNLETGKVLSVSGSRNAQARYGADVISRIVAANEGNLENLKKAVTGQICETVLRIMKNAGILPADITKMAVAANPTMCHLFAGLSPESIGLAPFTPLSYFGDVHESAEFGLPFECPVCILPSVSGYVGGDITADVIACGIDGSDEKVLLVDIGTNGEMLIGNRDGIVCCSTAAGPAFEGAQIKYGMNAAPGAISSVEFKNGALVCHVIGGIPAKGICGSGLIDAVSVMLELGVIDETGRLFDPDEDEEDISEEAKPYLVLNDDGDPEFRLSGEVCITQADIRKLQLGKGAIAAGIDMLMKKSGTKYEDISALLLAGGFGSYIRPESAAGIGLIPRELLPVTKAVGNTAIEGAYSELVSDEAWKRFGTLKEKMKYIELSGSKEFTDFYIENMMFE